VDPSGNTQGSGDIVDDNQALFQNSIFSGVDPSDLEGLTASMQSRRYGKGEWIVQHGDIWPHLFLIKAGEVTAIKDSFEGRSLMLATFKGGDIFWGLAFFLEDAPMPASLLASQPSEILIWQRQDILPLLLRNGSLSWELSRLMIRRVQLASDIVEQLAFHPIAGRLARLLIEFGGEDPQRPIPRSLTLDEMAARIGTTREMVCRFLHRFSDQGLIEITRTEFSVIDRKGLKEIEQHSKG
jgi:CRP/FNR family transcriptional regulator, cyclic AMP receptor protein